MSAKTIQRNQNFQKSLNSDEIKSQREKYRVRLRKQKRSDVTCKKRFMPSKSPPEVSSEFYFPLDILDSELLSTYSELTSASISSYDRLRVLINILKSTNNIKTLSVSFQALKKLSGRHKSLPLEYLLDENLIEIFISALKSDHISTQVNVLWISVNLFHSSNEIVDKFMNHKILDCLKDLLANSNCPDVIENTIWAIGNIIGDNAVYRDQVINKGIWRYVLDYADSSDLGVRQISYWVLGNISSVKPQVPLYIAQEILSVVKDGLQSENSENIENCANIAFQLSESYNDIIYKILNSPIIDELIKQTNTKNFKILLPVIKVLGNIASGTDKQTKALIDAGYLEKVLNLLDHPNIEIKREVYYIFGSMFATSTEIIETILKSPCMDSIVQNMSCSNFTIRKQALICICNATFMKSHHIIMKLFNFNILPGLIKGLDETDSNLLLNLVSAIKNIFKSVHQILTPDKWDEFLINFQQEDGISKLEDLQFHDNNEIHKEVQSFIQEFFGVDDKNDSELKPVSVFSFN